MPDTTATTTIFFLKNDCGGNSVSYSLYPFNFMFDPLWYITWVSDIYSGICVICVNYRQDLCCPAACGLNPSEFGRLYYIIYMVNHYEEDFHVKKFGVFTCLAIYDF